MHVQRATLLLFAAAVIAGCASSTEEGASASGDAFTAGQISATVTGDPAERIISSLFLGGKHGAAYDVTNLVCSKQVINKDLRVPLTAWRCVGDIPGQPGSEIEGSPDDAVLADALAAVRPSLFVKDAKGTRTPEMTVHCDRTATAGSCDLVLADGEHLLVNNTGQVKRFVDAFVTRIAVPPAAPGHDTIDVVRFSCARLDAKDAPPSRSWYDVPSSRCYFLYPTDPTYYALHGWTDGLPDLAFELARALEGAGAREVASTVKVAHLHCDAATGSTPATCTL